VVIEILLISLHFLVQ